MTNPIRTPNPGPVPVLQDGLLSATLRRDLADLNRQFLELGVVPELAGDPRFGWSDRVREGLLRTDGPLRERMAACPFALFEILLPTAEPRFATGASRVEDGTSARALPEPWASRCQTFVQFALFLAWRLADTVPLATRVALGLSAGVELRLNEMALGQLSDLAGRTDLVRPRWPAHARFWAMLRGAARSDSLAALQWAHCVGVCLLGTDLEATSTPAALAPPKRSR